MITIHTSFLSCGSRLHLKLRTDLLQIRPVDKPGEEVVHLLVAAQVLPLVTHPPLKHSEKGKSIRIGEYSSLSLRPKSSAIFVWFPTLTWAPPCWLVASFLIPCLLHYSRQLSIHNFSLRHHEVIRFPLSSSTCRGFCCEQTAARVPPVHQVATTGRAYLTMCKLIHQWADPFWNRGTHLSKSLHFLLRKIKEQKGVLCALQEQL